MKGKLPKHLAVIPDGNRRWARKRGLLPWEGHREGFKRFREISETAFRMGTPYFTFWAASEDNLTKRSRIEVKFLVSLLKEALGNKKLFESLKENDVCLKVIGKWNEILKDKKLSRVIAEIEEKTRAFKRHRLTVLFGYDGRREMLDAIAKICYRRRTGAELFPAVASVAEPMQRQLAVTADAVKQSLWTGDLPPVDLVIRTGGEPHWSAGFMMWLCADSQFYFTEKYWPDFTEAEFKKALEDYGKRERRFGR